jgi:hypothetical protein
MRLKVMMSLAGGDRRGSDSWTLVDPARAEFRLGIFRPPKLDRSKSRPPVFYRAREERRIARGLGGR